MANTQDGAVRPSSLAPEDYTVVWVCMDPIELRAAMVMLDEHHSPLKCRPKGDVNNYTLGTIGGHNVVIAHFLRRYGTNGPAVAGISMLRTFPNLRFGAMVGIGGGIPSSKNDIRLGDIAVSLPSGQAGGVIEHNMGNKEDSGFRPPGSSNGSPTPLSTAIAELRASRTLGREITNIVNGAFPEESNELWRFPEKETDLLFEDGNELGGDRVVQRKRRKSKDPKCFYGIIDSGTSAVKSAKERRQLAMEGVLCVDTAAASLINIFNCIVIRGVSNYTDTQNHKRWQPYALAVAAAFTKKLLCTISPQALKSHRGAHWYVPFDQNNQFIGREKHLEVTIAALNPKGFERNCHRMAITGLGGIGKTQIALEAAFRIRDENPNCSVFWISAATVLSFNAGFLEIGRQFQIPGITEDNANVKSLIKAYLNKATAGRWLLIVNNADNLIMLYNKVTGSDGTESTTSLADYLPFSRNGSILFITRNNYAATYLGSGSNVVTVEKMTEDESLQLLETTLNENRKVLIGDDAKKLARHLANLPLAIKQAAAYINQNKMTIATYLELYESSASSVSGDQCLIKLLSTGFEEGLHQNIHTPFTSTWLISFREIQQSDPLAAQYLYIMSCVAQRDIPRCLLPPAQEFEQIRAIGTLKAYGFITEFKDRDLFDIHPLVQLVARNWLKIKDELFQYSGDALNQVSRIFPRFTYENKNICAAYLPHAKYVLTFQTFPEDSQESLRVLLDNMGGYFSQTGNYEEAEQLYIQSLELKKQTFGEGDPGTLASMSNLAIVYKQQGDCAKAETLQQETLKVKKRLLGKDHQSTLASMNNLANVYEKQGGYAKAETLHQQTLALRKQTLGENHPDTLGSMNNIAIVYEHQRRYGKAETLYQQTLELRKETLGERHPDTLRSRKSLANVYWAQGKHQEAEALSQQEHGMTLVNGYSSEPAIQNINMNKTLLEHRSSRTTSVFDIQIADARGTIQAGDVASTTPFLSKRGTETATTLLDPTQRLLERVADAAADTGSASVAQAQLNAVIGLGVAGVVLTGATLANSFVYNKKSTNAAMISAEASTRSAEAALLNANVAKAKLRFDKREARRERKSKRRGHGEDQTISSSSSDELSGDQSTSGLSAKAGGRSRDISNRQPLTPASISSAVNPKPTAESSKSQRSRDNASAVRISPTQLLENLSLLSAPTTPLPTQTRGCSSGSQPRVPVQQRPAREQKAAPKMTLNTQRYEAKLKAEKQCSGNLQQLRHSAMSSNSATAGPSRTTPPRKQFPDVSKAIAVKHSASDQITVPERVHFSQFSASKAPADRAPPVRQSLAPLLAKEPVDRETLAFDMTHEDLELESVLGDNYEDQSTIPAQDIMAQIELEFFSYGASTRTSGEEVLEREEVSVSVASKNVVINCAEVSPSIVEDLTQEQADAATIAQIVSPSDEEGD